MKTLVILLNCYGDIHIFLAFFAGVVVTALVFWLIRKIDLDTIKEKKMIEDLVLSIQSTHMLILRNEDVAENRRRLKTDLIPTFVNTMLDSTFGQVDYGLGIFNQTLFVSITKEMGDVISSFRRQFQSPPDSVFPSETTFDAFDLGQGQAMNYAEAYEKIVAIFQSVNVV